MRNYATEAELECIPNVNSKRNVICQNYLKYGDWDARTYFDEQLEANPNLLAWLFDDDTLRGKSVLSFSDYRNQALDDFRYSLPCNDDLLNFNNAITL